MERASRTTGFDLLGMSYDNTGALGANTWRHVAFIEQPSRADRAGRRSTSGMPSFAPPGAATGAEAAAASSAG